MPDRHESAAFGIPSVRLPLFSALRETFREGYKAADLRADLLSGATVGIIALPLAMALAIASGVPPQYGLYTAIVAGALIAVLGGSRISVSGPTAAFVVILAPISAKYGIGGLLTATMMAGAIMVVMGLARMGRLIHFIPHPVTTGFTAGIAVVIATLQLKDFLGLTVTTHSDHYIDRVAGLAAALPTIRWEELLIGAFSLAVLIAFPRFTRRVPAPLVAVVLGTLLAVALGHFIEGFEVATITSRFTYEIGGVIGHGIPPLAPSLLLPWNMPDATGEPLGLRFEVLRDLIGPATAIALLGAIESLLCAVVADSMAQTKHDPDGELLAQGIGNLVAPFFGGIAATGAIARTAANVRAGARSPFSALFHAVFVLAALLLMAPLLGYMPMATLAALLLMVAWNMSDLRHFTHILKVAQRSDVVVLLTCFSLTVVFDMVIAVSVGVVLAALLFMRRMAELSEVHLADEGHPIHDRQLPAGVLFYEIAGPLFFGAAERALNAMQQFTRAVPAQTLILDMSQVPVIDVTGLVAFETIVQRLRYTGVFVILCGVKPHPQKALEKAGIVREAKKLAYCRTWEDAVELAELHAHFGQRPEVEVPPARASRG